MEAAGRETVSGDDEPFRQTSRFPALRCKRELNPEDAIVPSATGEEIMSNGTMADALGCNIRNNQRSVSNTFGFFV